MITDILQHLPAKFGACTRLVTISAIFEPNRQEYLESGFLILHMSPKSSSFCTLSLHDVTDFLYRVAMETRYDVD